MSARKRSAESIDYVGSVVPGDVCKRLRDSEVCMICWNDQSKPTMALLCCGSVSHVSCMAKWYCSTDQARCPICATIASESSQDKSYCTPCNGQSPDASYDQDEQSSNPSSPSASTDPDGRARSSSIEVHLDLLRHSARCNGLVCQSRNCRIMRDLLKHFRLCGEAGQCTLCSRMEVLFALHASSCCEDECAVPRCLELRQ